MAPNFNSVSPIRFSELDITREVLKTSNVNSNLTNIEITRLNTISNGGGRIKTKINLLDTLDLKDSSQNIRLYDGDTILISRNDKPVIAQIGKAIRSNINPRFIKVFVS